MSSTPSTPRGPDGAPLTRRQRRELERAREEARRTRGGQDGRGGPAPDQGQPASASWKPSVTAVPEAGKPATAPRPRGGTRAPAGPAPAGPIPTAGPPAPAAGPAAPASGAAAAWKPVSPAPAPRGAATATSGGSAASVRSVRSGGSGGSAAPGAAALPATPGAPMAPEPSASLTPSSMPAPPSQASPAPPGPGPEPAPGSRPAHGSGLRTRTHRTAQERAAQIERLAAQGPPAGAQAVPVTGTQKAIGAALGRRPRGLLAIGLAGVVVLAMVLVPLAVSSLGLRDQGPDASAQAKETVLSGDDPLESVVEVAGRPGIVPVVSLKGSLTPASSLHEDVLVQGGGRTVEEGDAVMLSISTFSGLDGRNTTGTASGASLRVVTLDESLGEDLDKAIRGKNEGSRLVLRAPHEEESGRTTEITVVDILPTMATGQEREPMSGMPAVTIGQDGTAQLSIEGLPAPASSTSTTLIQGQGPQVGKDDLLIARYSIINWSTGQVSGTSTYGDTVLPRTVDMRDTLAGISQSLVDVPVGSRVVLALPADQARGEDAVAVVIDVLAISSREDASAPASAPAGASPSASAPATASAAVPGAAAPAPAATDRGVEGP